MKLFAVLVFAAVALTAALGSFSGYYDGYGYAGAPYYGGYAPYGYGYGYGRQYGGYPYGYGYGYGYPYGGYAQAH